MTFTNSLDIQLSNTQAAAVQGLEIVVNTSAVPEPTSATLLGLGGLGLVLRRRRLANDLLANASANLTMLSLIKSNLLHLLLPKDIELVTDEDMKKPSLAFHWT